MTGTLMHRHKLLKLIGHARGSPIRCRNTLSEATAHLLMKKSVLGKEASNWRGIV